VSLNEHEVSRLMKAADRVEIMETLSRYHHLIDGRDWDALSSVFADDAESMYIRVVDGEIQTSPPVKGISAIRTWLESSLRPVETMHYMANHVFTSLDGDRAHTRSYLHVRGTQTGGMYEADHVRTAQGWRIARLSLEQHFTS
jgi:ketosteroid isomerase-like protein